MPRHRRSAIALLVCGLMCEAWYLGLAVRVSWPQYGHQLTSWSTILGRGNAPLLLYMAGVACVSAAYLAGWRIVRRMRGVPRSLVWGGALLFSTTLFWVYPITCDLFDYLGSAHLLTDLRANPLLVSRSAFPDHEFFHAYATPYLHLPSAYGPLWNLLAAPATLGAHDELFGIAWLKGLAVASFLACGWLIERIASGLARRRRHPESSGSAAHRPRRGNPVPSPAGEDALRPGIEALYLFAWNPLVLVATMGDGHNDLAMMALVLASAWCLVRQRPVAALVPLTFSAGIKYVSALLLPLWGLYLWRTVPTFRRKRILIMGAAFSVAGAAAMVAPFWDPAVLPSILARLLTPDTWTVAAGPTIRWLMNAGLALLAVAYVLQIWKLNRFYTAQQSALGPLVESACTLLLLTFLLGAARSQPWHLLWALALAPLVAVAHGWRATPTIVLGPLSALMLASFGWVEWGQPGRWTWPAVGAALALAIVLAAKQLWFTSDRMMQSTA
jgi:hypothetical protein